MPDDIATLQDISKDIYIYSRYYTDGHFDPEKYQRFYQIWVKNNCEAPSNMVLVGEIEGQVQGYLTGNISDKEPSGHMEIMGIRTEYQNSGIGYEIFRCGIEWYKKRGIELIWFNIPANNIPVQRLTQPFGFYTSNCQLYYHKWFSE